MTTTNESQLDPPPAQITNPTSPSTSNQTLINGPPISNEAKPETIDGPPSSNQQVETEKPVTPAEKTNKDEPVSNNVSATQATAPETKDDGTAEKGQDKTNKPHKPGVESEPTEQPSLTQLIKNKTLVDQEDGKPEPHNKQVAPNMRLCTVRLEILMEVDIVKHVHVHKETESKTVIPVEASEPVETVETVEMAHFTRSRAKTKSPQTNRLPRSVSNNIAYVHQEEQSDSDKSPSPKRK